MPRKAKELEIYQSLPRAILDDLQVRGLDKEKRMATFVAATEGGVLLPWGEREHLRMSGANLKRYRRNPVILDAHNRESAGAVIGKAEIKVEGRELLISVTFAETARAEEIWKLVQGGFVRAVSVGFIPDKGRTVKLEAGQEDIESREGKEDEASRIKGPATVIKAWTLFEVSVVPVGADPDALRREMREWAQEFLQPEEPTPPSDEESDMFKEFFQKWLEKRGHKLDGLAAEKRAELEAECQRELMAAHFPEPAKPDASKGEAGQAAGAARTEKPVADRLREVAPRNLKAEEVDLVVLDAGDDYEKGKKALRELQVKALQPAGTTEPAAPEKTPKKEGDAKEDPDKVRAEMEALITRGLKQ